MLKSIEELLKLQDWDKKILQHQSDLDAIGPHKEFLVARLENTQNDYKSAQEILTAKQSNQKQLEIEVATQEEKIRKYSHQQLETKKNEEYQALTKEIEHCKSLISETEDKLLEVMEEIEEAQSQVETAKKQADDLADNVKKEISESENRHQYLTQTLNEYKRERAEQAKVIDEKVLKTYERLFQRKAGTVLVGIERGMCGGCHMKLTTSAVIVAKGNQEISTCPNCGRLLYYLPGMELPEGV